MNFSSPVSFVTITGAVTGLSLLLSGCSEPDATSSELTQRDLSAAENTFKLVETSAERFRYESRPSSPHAGGAAAAPGAGSGPSLAYTTPEGWSEKAGSSMRDVSLSFGENGEGECYVARLPGAGGGLLANVNRWRKQMGADPLTQEEVDKLPTKLLFGQPAAYITVDGNFSAGMGSTETQSGYRLLGLILASDAGAVFVKMTGPGDLVSANESAFETFTSSLDVSSN